MVRSARARIWGAQLGHEFTRNSFCCEPRHGSCYLGSYLSLGILKKSDLRVSIDNRHLRHGSHMGPRFWYRLYAEPKPDVWTFASSHIRLPRHDFRALRTKESADSLFNSWYRRDWGKSTAWRNCCRVQRTSIHLHNFQDKKIIFDKCISISCYNSGSAHRLRSDNRRT